MDAQKSAVEHAAQGPHTEPHPGGSHARVTLTVLVLCAMFMSLLAPAATAATISQDTAGIGDQQPVSSAPGGGHGTDLSVLTAAPGAGPRRGSRRHSTERHLRAQAVPGARRSALCRRHIDSNSG